MAEYTNLADFSPDGFNIGKDSKVMTYLHGLSDFWVYMFEDASKINLLMEANALRASDTYNKFLQLSSVISLEGISTLTNSQIKLVLLNDEVGVGKVEGKIETYYLPTEEPLKQAKVLANRAFLPTSYLEDNADFYIDQELGQISFAKPLADLGFPFRIMDNGSRQYAIWAIDARVDDQLIYNYYAKLIEISPATSTDLFKGFVYGMYYLFVNGPHLETIRRGLNLTLGIPLARDVETVLEIRKYLNTDQWMVITDLNSYVIPYGLEPTVEVEDILFIGQQIAEWIEVKDYWNDGEWWINYMLPTHLLPHVPPDVPGGGGVEPDTQGSRYMTEGSYADWIMRNYLKKHTFLVNVKTISFKNLQTFEQLAEIIKAVKPSYTTPIYVWTVPLADEIIELIETFKYTINYDWCEPVFDSIDHFIRNSAAPLSRCCPRFIRMSAPKEYDDQLGLSPEINGSERTFNGGVVNGFINYMRGFRDFSEAEETLDRTFRTRDQDQYVVTRGKFVPNRDADTSVENNCVFPYRTRYPGYRLVYLYTTTKRDLQEKYTTLLLGEVPNDYIFEIYKPDNIIDAINEQDINNDTEVNYYDVLVANFSYLFNRGTNAAYLGATAALDSYKTYRPTVGDLKTNDFLVITSIGDNLFGVFWATTNFDIITPAYFSHGTPDPMTVKITGFPTRGLAQQGSPYFGLRGAGAIVDEGDPDNVSVTYIDVENAPFSADRSGRTLVTKRTWQ